MEDYVSYEQSVKLKELGFNWECNHFYDEDKELIKYDFHQEFYDEELYADCILAPTLSQVHKWLREVHHIDINIDSVYHILDTGDEIMYGLRISNQRTFQREFYQNYNSYEEALSIGIDKAFELLNEKNNGN